MTKLSQLQALRCAIETVCGKHSPIYYWAMCIAISAYSRLAPRMSSTISDLSDDVHHLADAIRKEGCA